MIFYQYDPEMDRDFLLQLIRENGITPAFAAELDEHSIHLRENEEIYIFSNDDDWVGLLWYMIDHTTDTLGIKSLYINEEKTSFPLEVKLLEFAVKKAKYLKMVKVQFQYDGEVDGTQLSTELGCNMIERDKTTNYCYLS
ncbi:hypothetical protein ACSVDE_04205 [Pseudalkalibacillus sp. Hm43]|uniref:hypothetical protein n=1 Tax=Pseudalkalibacillus sp. Hm43 TaxID=3450742 RepID=UPI003F43C98A